MSEAATPATVTPAPPAPDYGIQSISLAVQFYTGRNADEHAVLHTADEIYARLTRNRSVPPRVADEILTTLEAIDRKLDNRSRAANQHRPGHGRADRADR